MIHEDWLGDSKRTERDDVVQRVEVDIGHGVLVSEARVHGHKVTCRGGEGQGAVGCNQSSATEGRDGDVGCNESPIRVQGRGRAGNGGP